MPTRALLLLLAAVACGGDDAPAGDAGLPGDPGSAALQGDAPGLDDSRPETRTDTIMIEGLAEPMELSLFRAPEDFPLPFTAYVPEDMEVDAAEPEDEAGAALRFVSRREGTTNEAAFVHVYVHPEGTTPHQALELIQAYEGLHDITVSRGIEPLAPAEPSPRMPWAEQSYSVTYQVAGEDYLGSVGMATRNGRLFHILVQYPAGYAEGFGPRSGIIFETWRWADGEPLMDPAGTGQTGRR